MTSTTPLPRVYPLFLSPHAQADLYVPTELTLPELARLRTEIEQVLKNINETLHIKPGPEPQEAISRNEEVDRREHCLAILSRLGGDYRAVWMILYTKGGPMNPGEVTKRLSEQPGRDAVHLDRIRLVLWNMLKQDDVGVKRENLTDYYVDLTTVKLPTIVEQIDQVVHEELPEPKQEEPTFRQTLLDKWRKHSLLKGASPLQRVCWEFLVQHTMDLTSKDIARRLSEETSLNYSEESVEAALHQLFLAKVGGVLPYRGMDPRFGKDHRWYVADFSLIQYARCGKRYSLEELKAGVIKLDMEKCPHCSDTEGTKLEPDGSKPG